MDTDTGEQEVIVVDEIDASDLIVGQITIDDENYDEIIILDLRKPEAHDLWFG